MNTQLNIGPEERAPNMPEPSKHVINLKTVDAKEKEAAHREVSVDLKQEIKEKNQSSGRICILSELRPERRGLGRVPMLAAALLIIFVLNLGQLYFLGRKEGTQALALASEAFLSLQDAGNVMLTGEQGAELGLFQEAETLFNEAKEKGAFLLQESSPWLYQPEKVKSLQNLIDAGTLMAELGQHISEARQDLSTLPETGSLTEYIRTVSETHLEPATEELHRVSALLNDVDLSGTGYEDKLADFKEKLSALISIMDLWSQAKEPLLTALGDKTPQDYMILLENNDEMRMGGGFIGSIALVRINDGRITKIQFQDVYTYDGQYFEHQEVPVHELKDLTAEWRLRDSNISADFPTSAQKAMWFLQEEGGPGVDGVIGLNLSAAQAFLEDTGPIKLGSLPKELTAETFPAVISTLVEAKINTEAPKTILAEFLNAFVSKAKSDPKLQVALASTALEEAQKKQILFYHKDPSVQAWLNSMSLTGDLPELSTVDHDFFMPVFTNIGGNKTDRYVQTDIQHSTTIYEDGSMSAAITLTRTHTFNEGTMTWLKTTLAGYGFTAWNPTLESILGKAENHSGIRLYIPEGAHIVETEGILRDEIQFYYDPLEELSYYYIDQTLAPGESQSFTVYLSLPWDFHGDFEEYQFALFKQPGLKNVTFTKTVTALHDTLLTAYPLATDVQKDVDYILRGSLNNDVNLTLLYR